MISDTKPAKPEALLRVIEIDVELQNTEDPVQISKLVYELRDLMQHHWLINESEFTACIDNNRRKVIEATKSPPRYEIHMTRLKPPLWLQNYAKLEGARLVLSYKGRRVGYNPGQDPDEWFLCKCNRYKPDHQPCTDEFKWLGIEKTLTVDVMAWCAAPWIAS